MQPTFKIIEYINRIQDNETRLIDAIQNVQRVEAEASAEQAQLLANIIKSLDEAIKGLAA